MIVRFGPCGLDVATRELRRDGTVCHLSRKAFDLLVLLVERRPAVVDKASLRSELWGDTAVVEANLNNLVAEIRAVLDDDPQTPRYIRTVHRVGYAFIADAEVDAGGVTPAAGPAPPSCWLQWRERTFVLHSGANVIGRDPASAVWVDAPGVSRRHARIDVSGTPDAPVARLTDLASTNGTILQGAAITAPAALQHEDVIRVGRASLTYRLWIAGAETRRVRSRR